jgi:hypothetical protein
MLGNAGSALDGSCLHNVMVGLLHGPRGVNKV